MSRSAALLTLALAITAVAAPAWGQADGQSEFLAICAPCHQSNGAGIKDAIPPLDGSRVAQGDPAVVAGLALDGSGPMPGFARALSDAQIAAILTYVRSAWSNRAAPVSAAQVAAVRARTQPPGPAQAR